MRFRTKLLILAISIPALLIIAASPLKNAGILPYATHNGKIYLLLGQDRHRPGQWTDFGGRIEKGETPAQAAKREFLEETGGQITNLQITSQTPYITNHTKKYRMYLVKINYFNSKKLRKNPEKDAFVWIALDELLKQIRTNAATLYPPFAQTLRAGQSILKNLK